jgi:thiamine-phosphate pyrophosphorylase
MTKKIEGGVYLVVDPMLGLQKIFAKVKCALEGGVDVIQLWDHWNPEDSPGEFISAICALAHPYSVPVLIHKHWQLLEAFPLDGVHFDEVPSDLNQVRQQIGRPFLIGITCGNDQSRIDWAINNRLDYISFCSMFSSSTANSCELVRHDLVKEVRAITDMPIYVAGGITVDNLPSLVPLGISGVAVVSGIMKADDPRHAAKNFKQVFKDQTLNKT